MQVAIDGLVGKQKAALTVVGFNVPLGLKHSELVPLFSAREGVGLVVAPQPSGIIDIKMPTDILNFSTASNLLRNPHPKHHQLNFNFNSTSIQITYAQSTKKSKFDMSSNVLADKDINASATTGAAAGGAVKDVKSMEYHRQVLQSKLDEGQ